MQAHVVRILPRRQGLAFDGTYFVGGRVDIDGQVVTQYRSNCRLGLTYGYSFSPRQAIRFSYFEGVYARVGADTRTLGIACQVVWASAR